MSRRDFLQDFIGTSLWATIPAKRIFRYAKVINEGLAEKHRLALTMGGVVDRSLNDVEGLQSSDYSTYQIFEQGDLAFKLIDLQNIKTSRVGLVPRRGIMSPAYIRLRPRSDQVCPEFYYWYFYAAYRGNIFNGLGGGIRQNLSQTELLEFPVPDIPRHDQEAIASFLARETSRVDSLIDKKARFLDLLEDRLDGEIIDRTAPQDSWQAAPFWSLARAKCVTGMAAEGLLSVYLDRGVIPYSEGGGLVHKPAETIARSVRSGFSAIRVSSQSRSPAKTARLLPPIGRADASPVVRYRCDQRTAVARPTPKRADASRHVAPDATHDTTRSRRS